MKTRKIKWTPPGKARGFLEDVAASEPTDDCIEWPFYRHPAGYGQLGTAKVSHVILEMVGRPRPSAPNDHALHSCDNPPCCNPRHLRWGSIAENMAEMVARGRNTPVGKVTAADVAEIRSSDESCRAIGARFGISHGQVSRIRRGLHWTHPHHHRRP